MVKNGVTLLSAHDPEGRCRKIAEAVSLKDRTLYFCPSVLYGYGLDVLLARIDKEAPNSAVLCVEADLELWGQGTRDKGQGTGKICYTNITEPEKLCTIVRDTWGARAFRRIEMVKLTGGFQLYPELYNSLFETLRSEIALDWSNALTLTKLGRLYIRNFFKNLDLISNFKSISELSFGDSDVLVLAAGPSLDETLNNYSRTFVSFDDPKKRQIKIICVDTCLGALRDRGIIPDLVVVLESQHWNLRDFVGCKNWSVPVAFDMSALSQSAFILAGQGYLFFTPWTELAIFERMKKEALLPDEVPPLGSVGLTAIHIARKLTKGTVTTAGFDFCFSIDKYHARGTPSHREKLNKHNRFGGLIGFEAFREGIVKENDRYTNPIMRNYKEIFEREFSKKTLARRRGGAEDAEKKMDVFIKSEVDRLYELRDMLVGEKTMNKDRLEILIKECDYLWAHFPDYAGGVEPNINDKSFLNRIRVEIDRMLNIITLNNNSV